MIAYGVMYPASDGLFKLFIVEVLFVRSVDYVIHHHGNCCHHDDCCHGNLFIMEFTLHLVPALILPFFRYLVSSAALQCALCTRTKFT